MTRWLNSRFTLPALFAALLALAPASPAQAEVFTESYTTTEYQGFTQIIDTMLGKGFAANPSGKLLGVTKSVQVGVFSNLCAKIIPSITNGVILSTGLIENGAWPENTSACYDHGNDAIRFPEEPGDSDLKNYFGDTYNRDPAGLILYIQPKNKTINVPYVMASEEFYLQSDDCPEFGLPNQEYDEDDYTYNYEDGYKYYSETQDDYGYDRFAIFIKEVSTDAEGKVIDDGSKMTNNLAVFKDGAAIDITTVNQHTNSEFFISNVVTNESGYLLFPTNDLALPMEFNGAINGTHKGLVAVADVETNKTYKLKIVIADGGVYNIRNSVLFLRTEGITSGADLKIDVTGPAALSAPGPVSFTNTLSNVGPATADGVVVTNWLPKGILPTSMHVDAGKTELVCGMDGSYLIWRLGDRFASGSNAVMTIECDLPAKGVYTNLAHVITSTGDYEPSNDTDDHVVTVGSLPELTIDLISTNKCYGEAVWIDPITYLAKIDGTNASARLTGFTVSFTNAAGAVVDPAPTNAAAKVGTYGITLSNLITEPVDAFGDRVTINGGIFEITNRCLTITASDTNKVYGTTIDLAQDAFKITAGSLADGETITQVSITSKNGLAGNAKAPVGIHVDELKPDFPVTGTGGFDPSNYTISFSNGTLTVTKATLAVAAPNIVKVYDGAGTNVTAAIVGDQPLEGNVPTYLYSTTQDGPYVEWQNLQYTNVVFDGVSVTSNQVWYKVSTDPENYFAATNWAWVTITQRCVTVQAEDATKKPGTPDPDPFAWHVADAAKSIVAGEETDVYAALTNDVDVSGKLYRTPDGETKGDYTITTNAPFASFTTGVLANYAFAFAPGTLTITEQTPLTFYIASTNVAYGAEIPTGFRFDHTVPATYDPNMIPRLNEVTFGTDYAKGSAVGDYTIITNNDALASVYYAITVVPGTLTVTQRCVTVKSESATKAYAGTPLSTNEVKVVAGSFADGEGLVYDNFASQTDVGKVVNEFTYKVKEGTTTAYGNYDISQEYGELEVTPAPILPVKPGETPPTDPTKAWTHVENVIKCYDGLGTNIWPTSDNLVEGNEPTYRYGTSAMGPFDLAWDELQFTNVVFDAYGNVTSNPVWYVVTTWNGSAANYFMATNSAYVMITQRCVTVTADDTNKVYGTTIAFAGTEFTAVGLTNDETIASVTLTSDGAGKTADVNEYVIEVKDPVFEKGRASNYKFTFNPGTLTVTKAMLAVLAPNIVKVYDGAGTNVTAAITGDQPLEGNVPTYLYSTTQDGPYVEWQNLQYTNVVFNEGAVSSNRVWYKVSTEPENYFAATNWAWVTITPRPLTVAADNATKKPGADDPNPFAWHVEDVEQSIVAGEETSVYTALTNDVGVSEKLYRTPSGEAKGEYTITTNAPFAVQTTGVLANYALAFTPGTLTISDKDSLTFYVASTNVAYGAAVPTVFSFDHTDPATYDSEKVMGLDTVQFKTTYYKKAPVSGETYDITTNSALSSVAYDIAVVPGTLTVTPAPLTIVASNAVKVYGTVLTLTGREFEPPVGLVDDETVTNVTLSCAQAALPAASVGDYTIALGAPLLGDHGFNEANYTLDPTNGTLTVTKARITPYAPGEATPPAAEKKAWTQAANIVKCYDGLGTNITPTANLPWGDAPHYLFSTNAAGPFVAWQNLQFTNVTFGADGSIASNRVYYTVTTTKETANYENYFAATNYAYVVITQRCVTVTAQPQTKQFGSVVDLDGPTTEFTVAPTLPNGESIVSVTRSCPLAKDPAATVGDHAGAVALSHPVTGAGANFSTNNYNIAFSNGTLKVTERLLTVTAIVTNKPYGAEFVLDATRFIASIVGTNGTETVTGIDVVFSNEVGGVWAEAYPTNATAPAGSYRIYLSNIAGPGYEAYSDITYIAGTLTIDKKPLTITADDTNKVYGTAIAFAGTEFMKTPPQGLRNGETITNVTLSCAEAANEGASVGDYAIVPSDPKGDHGFDLANYALDPTNGTLTVTKARITPYAPGAETPSAAEKKAWTQAANIVKCYDGLGVNISPTANLPWGDAPHYLFSTNETGPFVANLQFTNVTCGTDGSIASNRVYYTIATDKGGVENYFAATNYAYVTITQRCVTVFAPDWTRRQGVANPTDEELTAGCMTSEPLIPGNELVYGATCTYTEDEVGTHVDVIVVSGEEYQGNYRVSYVPGNLTVTKKPTPTPTPTGTPRLVVSLKSKLNWNTGLIDLELTISNVGNASVNPACVYGVQLTPGPAATGSRTSIACSYYLASSSGARSDSIDLTSKVQAALRGVGNRDSVFDAGESVTVKGFSVYHWKRSDPSTFIDLDTFFTASPLETPQVAQTATPTTSGSALRQTSAASAVVIPEFLQKACVFDAILCSGEDLAGTVRVTLGAANRKTGLSALTAAIAEVGAKKVTVTGKFDSSGTTFEATAKDGRRLSLTITADGVSGAFGDGVIEGARNRYSSKTADDKAVVAKANKWVGTYTIARPVDAFVSNALGYDTFTLKIAKNGRATVAGTLADGTRISCSSLMILGADGYRIPIVYSSKKVALAFCVWLPPVDADVSSASVEIIGLDNAIVSPVGNLTDAAAFTFDADALSALVTNETTVLLADYLPVGAEVLPDGKKWIVMPDANGKTMKTGSLVWDRKACAVNEAKSKIAGYNVAALRLTYTAGTGCFTGSFKVFTVVKNALRTTTVTIRGIVVDGVGYGTATVKGKGCVAVRIE